MKKIALFVFSIAVLASIGSSRQSEKRRIAPIVSTEGAIGPFCPPFCR